MMSFSPKKKVLVFDFGCHDFILSLAKGLSDRNYSVLHLYSEDYLEGKLISNSPTQNEIFVSSGIRISNIPANTNIFRRLFYELLFTIKTLLKIRDFKPDLIIIGTSPLIVSTLICHTFRKVPRIYWHQDSYSVGIANELSNPFMPFKHFISRIVFRLEKRCLIESAAIVSIGENFKAIYEKMNIDNSKISYLENWATCEHSLSPRGGDKINSRLHSHKPEIKLIYAGTLGLKHLPELIIYLYNQIAEKTECKLTILTNANAQIDLLNLIPPESGIEIGNFKEKSDFCEFLGTFDFGVTILSGDASEYSVPSKIFTYAAHGLALISLVPWDNPSAKTTLKAGGIWSDPSVEGAQRIADILGQITLEDMNQLRLESHDFSRNISNKEIKVDFFERIIDSVLTK